MPIRISDGTVLHSFNETIPRAASHGEKYLRAVANGVQEYEPPVTMSIDFFSSGGFRSPQIQCLVVEPTSPRLRHYKAAHYGAPSGASLKVGWYLVGAERAGGRQIGYFNLGAATDLDVDEVMSIVETVHTYAVLPAIQQIVDLLQHGHQHPGGFLGV
ncbi:hypothetical protein ACSMXN_22060 [Jatrophihabitans sp. DSM 45814]